MPPARQPSWSTPYPLYDPSGRSPECLPHRTPGVLRSTMSCVSWRMAHAILAALREAVESACRVRLHETGGAGPVFGCQPTENRQPDSATRLWDPAPALRLVWVPPTLHARPEFPGR